MADPDEANIIFNVANLGYTRSLRAIHSPLLSTSAAETFGTEENSAVGQDEFEKEQVARSETSGIGKKREHDAEEDELDRPLLKRPATDKLLEQLLGSKAARAKKKKDAEEAQKLGKSTHLTSKPSKDAAIPRRLESDSEDEGGRAAMLGTKKKAPRQQPSVEAVNVGDGDGDDDEAQVNAPGKLNGHRPSPSTERPKGSSTTKKKATSFLDELLSNPKKKRKGN